MTNHERACSDCGYPLTLSGSDLCLRCTIHRAKTALQDASGPIAQSPPKNDRLQRSRPRSHPAPTGYAPANPVNTKIELGSRSASPEPTKPAKPITKVLFPDGDTVYLVESRKRGTRNMRCTLCGKMIPEPEMADHLKQRHPGYQLKPGPKSRKGNVWVSVVQGGLPGLGKRK